MKCKTNLKHQTGCGRQRWRKRKRKSGKTEGGRQTGAALGPVATGCVCVCVCVSWEGTVGEFGGMEEGIRALGPAPQGTQKMGREWREGMGEGRRRVKGRDVVSSEFENSAGRDNEEGGRKRRQRRGEERRGGSDKE